MLSEPCQQPEKSLGELLEGLPILQLHGDASIPVMGLAYHSGRVRPGEVFVALKGLQTDGHRFIPQAIARGARVLVVEDEVPREPGLVYVQTPDTRMALAHMAAVWAGHPSRELTLIGLTGTNGKTTTSYLLEAIWQASGARVGVIGTVNCRFGGQVRPSPVTTPESLELQNLLREMRSAQVACAIMEVSSHALDMRRVHASRFAAAVFTNLTQDHLDYHQDLESYFAAKARLFTEVLTANGAGGLAVLNQDDPWGQRLRRLQRLPVLTYGFSPGVDVRPRHYTLTSAGIQAVLETPAGPLEISSPLLGHYNLANILAATATALGLGLAPDHIISGLAAITGVDGRLEPVVLPGQPLVLVDYAHTPDALQQVLKALRALSFARLITVFGCGGDRDKTKRPLMGQAAAQGSDLVIVTSDNPRTEDPLAIIDQIVAGLQELGWPCLDDHDVHQADRGYLVVPDRRQAIRLAVQLADPTDVILLAGKGHDTY
ncbi:MAG: UDP-N-acetylmuramoyl-L-alanyl-D-glutamate--2,6-diaminopimelate ligase, partial [Desulfobacca sp.]|uniref:UDP-N-acetylmuramoyl-L-alanyl-D-glutamate--2, 6-diaminopimelate ligase n=1 Tax=Desulfobacca sp. TaxID=2067990 RepID=UPI00404A9AA4